MCEPDYFLAGPCGDHYYCRMESKGLRQIEGWFKKLNQRFDDTNRKIENRHMALLNVCTNIRKEVTTMQEVLNALRKEVSFLRRDLDGFPAYPTTDP